MNTRRAQSRKGARARVARRASAALVFSALISPVSSAVAVPSDQANCVATFYANEAFGPVGKDVRGWATSDPRTVGEFSSTFAKYHDGSLDGCLGRLGGAS